MMFKDLLIKEAANPEEQQILAAKHFSDELYAHGMRLWQPGDPY